MTMTQQQALDAVTAHLFRQGHRATYTVPEGAEFCAYRTEQGDKCAIGYLISDEHYTPEMEGSGVEGLRIHGGFNLSDLDGLDTLFLGDLQNVHDSKENWNSSATLADALCVVADKHGLSDATILIRRDVATW